MEASLVEKYIEWPTVIYIQVLSTVLLVLASFIMATYRKLPRRKHVDRGAKEKPKKSQELDKTKVAHKEW